MSLDRIGRMLADEIFNRINLGFQGGHRPMNYTPAQLATRYRNAANKLGAILDTLEDLSERKHGEGLSTYAGSARYYLEQVCESLERTAAELDAGHTRTAHNTLVGTRVVYHCICGYQTDSGAKLDDHVSSMTNTVGESSQKHGDRAAFASRLERVRAKHERTGGPDEQELADMGRSS
jgi:hypothetical protein